MVEASSFRTLFVFLFVYWCGYALTMMSPMSCDLFWGNGDCTPVERWMTFFCGFAIFWTAAFW